MSLGTTVMRLVDGQEWRELPPDALLADQVQVSPAVVDGRPGLVLEFAYGAQACQPIVLVLSPRQLAGFPQVCEDAAQQALANDGLTAA